MDMSKFRDGGVNFSNWVKKAHDEVQEVLQLQSGVYL